MKRPSEDQIERVCALIRGGADVDEAAANQGIDPAEFDVWLHKPRNRSVLVRVQNALAQADLTDRVTIRDAAGKTWQAAKARLEMRKVSERERQLYRLRALTIDS